MSQKLKKREKKEKMGKFGNLRISLVFTELKHFIDMHR